MEKLYQITLPYACFGIIVFESIIEETAPIGRWMLGKRIGAVRKWVKFKKGSIRGPIVGHTH